MDFRFIYFFTLCLCFERGSNSQMLNIIQRVLVFYLEAHNFSAFVGIFLINKIDLH